MEIADWITIAIIWLIIISISLFKVFCYKKNVQEMYGKRVEKSDPSTQKAQYMFVIQLSHPSDDYNLRLTEIKLELITNKSTLMAQLLLSGDSLMITRNIGFVKEIRSYIKLILIKSLHSLTKVRAIHKCEAIESKIFLEGIELFDMKSGERRFYSVQKFIYNEGMETADVLNVKEHDVRLCSKQCLTPNFIPLTIEDFGRPLKTIRYGNKDKEESNGVIVSPKLNTLEAIIFYVFFINLMFFLSVSIILVFLWDSMMNNTYGLTAIAILIPGFISLIATESLAIIYREYIKYYYNSKCAPMLRQFNESSNLWTFIRICYLIVTFLFSVVFSILIPVLIQKFDSKKTLAENYNFKIPIIKSQTINEICFLLMLFMVNFLVTVTLWFIIFGFLRYIYRKNCDFPKVQAIVDIESAKEVKDNVVNDVNVAKQTTTEKQKSTDSTESTQSKSNTNKKTEKSVIEKSVRVEDSEKHKKKIKVKSKKDSKDTKTGSQVSATTDRMSSKSKDESIKSTTGQLSLGTELLQQKIADNQRDPRLSTKSVIVKPTKSLGFINPEEFRLSEESPNDFNTRNK